MRNMIDEINSPDVHKLRSALAGPDINPEFSQVLDELVAAAKKGQRTDCEVYDPSDQWLKEHMPILQKLPQERQEQVFDEIKRLQAEAEATNAEGKSTATVCPKVIVQLDNQGLDIFSQFGVMNQPDLIQYFIDRSGRNQGAEMYSEEHQQAFTEVFQQVASPPNRCFESGVAVAQTDRQISDPGCRPFHTKQLFSSTKCLQSPYQYIWQAAFGMVLTKTLGPDPPLEPA